MKIFGTAALLAGAVLLSACGGGSHATCKDEASYAAYVQKWTTDFQAAVAAGKIDQAKAMEVGQEMSKNAADIKDIGAACTKLDEMRSKLGF